MGNRKPLVWLKGQVKTPPFSTDARVEAGSLLGRLQEGETLSLPHSRPMRSIESGCHELRINDRDQTWRIVYAIELDAVVVLEVFSKKTAETPKKVIETCREGIRKYRRDAGGR